MSACNDCGCEQRIDAPGDCARCLQRALTAAREREAALRRLCGRLAKYAIEDKAVTPGSTRLARVVAETLEHLQANPEEG